MPIKFKTFRIAAVIVSVTAIAAFSADWPNWRGADRTNRSRETGLLRQWPADGPRLLWTASGIGEGYSGVSVADGVIYTAGVKNNVNYVFAIDRVSGRLLWERAAGPAWEATRAFARAYSGARATPTVDGGMVYYQSDSGNLIALDAKTGAVRWSLNLRETYRANMPEYGYTASPFVMGDRLFAAAYGSRAGVVALDKRTGRMVWESPPKISTANRGAPGYASFIPAEFGGFRQIVAFTSTHVYGMDSENGNTLWSVSMHNERDNNCTDVIYHNGYVLASTGYGIGTKLIKLEQSGRGISAREVYHTKDMDNHHGGILLHDGHVYGSGHNSRGWFCLDFRTGQRRWNAPGKGSLTFAEGMLYMYEESGRMRLVTATPEAFTEVSSFQVPSGGRGAHWAHPVISHGVLYLRHANNLYAYDISGGR
jgi:outer membrane protein assembly factor BamB